MSTSCWWRGFFFFSWLLNPPDIAQPLLPHFTSFGSSHCPSAVFPCLVSCSTPSAPASLQSGRSILCECSTTPLYGRLASENKLSSKSSSFPPQESLGQSMKCSSIHSLIHSEMWFMTEAATWDGFLLVRCIFTLPSPMSTLLLICQMNPIAFLWTIEIPQYV